MKMYLILSISVATCMLIRVTTSVKPELRIEQVENSTWSNLTHEEYNTSEQTSVDRSSYGNLSQHFVRCQKTELDFEHFKMLENGSVYVPNYTTSGLPSVYDPGDYYLTENGVFICFYPKKTKEKPTISLSDEILEYLSFIGMILSLVFLFLHFIAFLLVPEMRNLPGKTLASLTFSLFFAYLFFLIGKTGYWKTHYCYPIGTTAYYFFMASFFWMNAISFSIFRSFRQASSKLRLFSKNADLQRFVLYSLYSWGIPAIFLIIVVVADEIEFLPENLTPGFKYLESSCWFNKRLSNTVFFIVPFAITVAANIIFFIFSAFIIFTNTMKADNQTNVKVKRFFLYLKLAVIMGLGWTIALVAMTVNETALWYVFVILVTLQGLFIFISFTKFGKTKHSLQQRLRRFKESIKSSSSYRTEELRLSERKCSSMTVNGSKRLQNKLPNTICVNVISK